MDKSRVKKMYKYNRTVISDQISEMKNKYFYFRSILIPPTEGYVFY